MEGNIKNNNLESLEQENLKKLLSTQISFATKAQELNQISMEDSLLQYTSIYRGILKLPRPISKDNPVWRDFIDQCLTSNDFNNSAWEFVQKHKSKEKQENKEQKKKFGPFGYEYDPIKKSVILHFDSNGVRSMDPSNGDFLRESLKKMFSEVKIKYPEAILFESTSWIDKFLAKFFPKEFITNAVVKDRWFKSESAWGQFKTSSGIREKSIKEFLDKVKNAKSNEDLQNAFRYQVLYAKCSIEDIYKLYL